MIDPKGFGEAQLNHDNQEESDDFDLEEYAEPEDLMECER